MLHKIKYQIRINYIQKNSQTRINKEKHVSCKNCTSKAKVVFKNNVIFCFGLIKKVYMPKDYYRYCIIKNNNKNCTDIMLEEVYSIISGLSRLLLDKRTNDILKRKKK